MAEMRILVVGSGGVGAAFAPIAARRDFYDRIVFADYDEGRAARVVGRYDGDEGRFGAGDVEVDEVRARRGSVGCIRSVTRWIRSVINIWYSGFSSSERRAAIIRAISPSRNKLRAGCIS